jgi:hypothetical protein
MANPSESFTDVLRSLMSIRNENGYAELSDGDAVALHAAHAREVAAARREGILLVIKLDKHAFPLTFSTPRHGPCHPSDRNRMCSAHRVLSELDETK